MADADEDAIPRSDPYTSNDIDPSYDPEDEAQDFRFLASLGTNTSLPKRGEKDFEPNPTKAQASTLNASREAMYHVLSVERVHPPRTTPVGVYLPNARDWRHDVATDRVGAGARCVVVEKFKGTHNKSLGKEDFRNWTWLLPEEALFLLERGSLDIRWPDEDNGETIIEHVDESEDETNAGSTTADVTAPSSTGNEASGNDSVVNIENRPKAPKTTYTLLTGEMPMSLQAAYACLLGKSGLTLERYIVYAGLKRLGYIVQRAPTWEDEGDRDDNHAPSAKISQPEIRESSQLVPPMQLVAVNNTSPATNLINRLVAWLFTSKPRQHCPPLGPLISPGIYRNYNDIFRTLTLIPYHSTLPSHTDDNTTTQTQTHSPTPTSTKADASRPRTPQPPFKIHFTVSKPAASQTYKKSSPPPPDFLLSVLDARTTTIPTLDQISTLLASVPPDPLVAGTYPDGKPRTVRMETRLKHGARNVILAIVDGGIVSYLRVCDMGFGDAGRVFEEKTRRATKFGGGRGGGSGRGRGRGRGRGGGGGASTRGGGSAGRSA